MLIKMLLVAGLVATAHTAPVGLMQDRVVPENEFIEASSTSLMQTAGCPDGYKNCGGNCVKGECKTIGTPENPHVNTGSETFGELTQTAGCPDGYKNCGGNCVKGECKTIGTPRT